MNVVYFLSDQHNPFFTGCYGHPIAETPNMDRLAADGVRFENSYCNSPLCVPARASLFTGRYVFEHACWDNVIAWDGAMRGWPHYLQKAGVHLTTIGKLDFKHGVDHGIENELLPIHRKGRDIHSLYRENRDNPPRWSKKLQMDQSGPKEGLTIEEMGDSSVIHRAIDWLKNDRPCDRPWVLNINVTNPHPGWALPPDVWEKWNPRVTLDDLPEKYFEAPESLHPYILNMAHHQCGLYATDEEMRRGHVGYLGRIDITDRFVGRVLDAMDELNILDDTLFIYNSDHGENACAHRIWGKMNMYEDSLRVPLMVMGPGVKKGMVDTSPVSHLDIFPTIADALGLHPPADFRGISLMPTITGDTNAPRNEYVMSEFHANGAPAGEFAVSDGEWKYVEMVGERPMLFDLKSDPQELHDLMLSSPDDPDVKKRVADMRGWLCNLLSPQGVDVHAKRDQRHAREELDHTGQLVEEIVKRGYERRTDKLVNRDDILPNGKLPSPYVRTRNAR